MRLLKNKYTFSLILGSLILGWLVFTFPAQAQLTTNDIGLNYAANIGFGGTRDLRDIIGNVIQIALGFLGIVAVGIMLYGGFQWMTAAGDPGRIESAKKTLINGLIGLVIVILSYSITFFVIRSLTDATQGPGGPGGPGSGPVSGGGFNNGGFGCTAPTPVSPATVDTPYVCSISTPPGGAKRGDSITIFGDKFGPVETGQVFVFPQGYQGDFTDCNNTDDADDCYEATVQLCGATSTWETDAVVIEVPGLPNVGTYQVAVKNVAGDSTMRPTGTVIDNDIFTLVDGEAGPSLTCLTPDTGARNSALTALGKRFGAVKGAGSDLNFTQSESQTVAASFTAEGWSDETLQTLVPSAAISGQVFAAVGGAQSNALVHKVSCSASADCSIGTAGTAEFVPGCCQDGICVLPEFCGLSSGDSCSADIDCLGDLTCVAGVCTPPPGPGDACTVDGPACLGGSCVEGVCVASPIIDGFYPINGAPGTLVTISGSNFGSTAGTVTFGTTPAAMPTGCSSATWSDNQILVIVPQLPAGSSERITVTPAAVAGATSTDAFVVNNIQQFGLCDVYNPDFKITLGLTDPAQYRLASAGDEIVYDIQNLGTETPILLLSGEELEKTSATEAIVPDLVPSARYKAQVQVGSGSEARFSNPITFQVTQAALRPTISYLDSVSGPTGQMVTIYGSNFGDNVGKITFQQGTEIFDSNDPQLGVFSFSEECSDADYWQNGSITFKVPVRPESISNGNLRVSITTAGTPQTSNDANFELCQRDADDCPLKPGICKIVPNQGRADMSGIRIYGEGFGQASDCAGSGCAVRFFNNQLSSITPDETNWNETRIGISTTTTVQSSSPVIVPSNAETGPVDIIVAGQPSNTLNFTVADCRNLPGICTDAARPCCQAGPNAGSCVLDQPPADPASTESYCQPATPPLSNLRYRFLTGVGRDVPGVPVVKESILCLRGIQSPSPFLNTSGNCVNAQVSASFVDAVGRSVQMDPSSFTDQTIQVRACPNENPEETDFQPENCETTPIAGGDIDTLANNTGFLWMPAEPFTNETWYQVTLISSGDQHVRSVDGLWLDGDRDRQPGGDYSWSFRIGNDPAACQVSRVEVLPDQETLTALDQTVDYSASVMAQNCNLLNPNSFDWTWSSSREEVATISQTVNPNFSPLYHWKQTATPLDQGVTFIGAEPATDEGVDLAYQDVDNRLVVDLKIPEITSISPADGTTNPNVKNYVTIEGKNFGDSQGNSKVTFGSLTAELVQCGVPWLDTKVMVQIPGPKLTPGGSTRIIDRSLIASALAADRNQAVMIFPFDESSGGQTADLGGVFATLSENLQLSEGINGQALNFPANPNEETILNPYLQIPGGKLSDSASPLSVGAVEFWFKTEQSSGEQILFSTVGEPVDGEANSFVIKLTGDAPNQTIRIEGRSSDREAFNMNLEPGSIQPNAWYHFAYVAYSTDARVFLNGTRMNGGLFPDGPAFFFKDVVGGADFAYLGSDGTPVNRFVGQIDNLAIFNQPLTRNDIAEHGGAAAADDVIGLFHFEEEGTATTDSSVNELPVSFVNYPSRLIQNGLFGQGLNFDGNDDALMVGPAPEIIYNRGLTVSAWVKTEETAEQLAGLTSPRKIFSTDLSGGIDGGFVLSIGQNPGVPGTSGCGGDSICFGIKTGGGAFRYASAAINNINSDPLAPEVWKDGEWNFVAGTYDNYQVKLYVNGKLASSFPDPKPSAEVPYSSKFANLPICLGASLVRNSDATFSCQGEFYKGGLDEAAIYNYALSESEISSLNGVVFENGVAPVKVTTNRGTSREDINFAFSDRIHPFLCSLDPVSGPQGIEVLHKGENFGDTIVEAAGEIVSKVIFGAVPPEVVIRQWANRLIQAINPFGSIRAAFVRVKVQTQPTNEVLLSNAQNFYFRPVILTVSPDIGPETQWVTITGYNFGPFEDEDGNQLYSDDPADPNYNNNGVFFTGPNGLIKAELAPCNGAWNFENNGEILVQVPDQALSGPIFVRSTLSPVTLETGPFNLDSNDVNFTVTQTPPGPGLCGPIPSSIRPGQDMQLSGVRFGDRPATGELEKIKLNQSVNLAAQILNWTDDTSDEPTPLINLQNIELRSSGSGLASGFVQIFKDTVVGTECTGFQIGNFCPGGEFVEIVESLPSNPVKLEILQGYACALGNPGTEEGIAPGWENGKNIFYRKANDTLEANAPISLSNLVSDGTYLYARSWMGSYLPNGAKPGLIAKISLGYDGRDPGELLQWYLPAGSTSLATEIDQTANFFMVGGQLAYAPKDFGGNVKLVNLGSLPADQITLASTAGLDENFTEMGTEYSVSTIAPDVPLADFSTDAADDGKIIAASNQNNLFNVYKTGDAYTIRRYETGETSITSKDVFTAASATDPATLDVRGILASGQYLYLIGWTGLMDIIDWQNKTFLDRIEIDNGDTGEINGFFDQINSEIYLGEFSNATTPNDQLYKYGECAIASTNYCRINSDCQACGLDKSQCLNNKCTPVITEVTPNTAPVGSWITLLGCYFDDANGTVTFTDDKPGITPTISICGDTWEPGYVVIEVPKDDGLPGNDAVTGPITLRRSDGVTVSTDDPKFGLPADGQFTVGGNLLPQVCALTPNAGTASESGTRGTDVAVRGRRFSDDQGVNGAVTFMGQTAPGDEKIATVGDLDALTDDWTVNKINISVPAGAASGPVEVTQLVDSEVRTSANKIPFQIYTNEFGPRLAGSNPIDDSNAVCRNAAVVLNFDQELDPASVTGDNIELFACSNIPSPLSFIRELWASVLRIFGRPTMAVLPNLSCTPVGAPLVTDLNYSVVDGQGRVEIVPSELLSARTRYQAKINAGLLGANGLKLNHAKSSQPGSLELPVVGASNTVIFDTIGVASDPGSGICRFDDMKITVFHQSDLTAGEQRDNDNFLCTGENCKLDFDFDQTNSIPGNQHRYKASATSELVNSATYSDTFERGALNSGTNTYSVSAGCAPTLTQGRLNIAASSGGCEARVNNGQEFSGTNITVEADLVSSAADFGLLIGDNKVYRELISGHYLYVIETPVGVQKIETSAFPVISHWKADFSDGSISLTVNDQPVLKAAAMAPLNGMGLYVRSGSGSWDNLSISAQNQNYLAGQYTWSRNDQLDPLRLINLNAAAGGSKPDNDKVASTNGEVYADANPIKQGSTKIAVQVGSNQSNVLVKEFPINIFICQNPWPNYNDKLKSDIYNFATNYCRDAGDVDDFSDDLPAASILDAELFTPTTPTQPALPSVPAAPPEPIAPTVPVPPAAPTPTVTPPSIESSMVSFWKFDEATGSTVSNSISAGLNATFNNIPEWTAGYWPGSGAARVGQSPNRYVRLTRQSALQPLNGFTLDLWFKPESFPATGTIIDNSVPGPAGDRGGYAITSDSAGRVSLSVLRGDTLAFSAVTSSAALELNEWNHIAVTYSPTLRELKIYINGVLEGTTANSIVMNYNWVSTYPFTMGVAYNQDRRWAIGQLDNVALYNRALTDAEVLTVYGLVR